MCKKSFVLGLFEISGTWYFARCKQRPHNTWQFLASKPKVFSVLKSELWVVANKFYTFYTYCYWLLILKHCGLKNVSRSQKGFDTYLQEVFSNLTYDQLSEYFVALFDSITRAPQSDLHETNPEHRLKMSIVISSACGSVTAKQFIFLSL